MSSTRGLANGGIQYRFDLARVNIRANQVRAVLYHFDLYLPAGAATYLDYRWGICTIDRSSEACFSRHKNCQITRIFAGS